MLLLALLLALPARSAELSFDQAVDVSAAAEALKASGARERKAPAAGESSGMGLERYDTDCVRFVFKPADAESEAVWLRSQEWEQQCQYDPRRGQVCSDFPGMLYQEKAWMAIPERKPLFPWETETFRVCLRGPWLYFDVLEGAYDYASEARRQSGGVNLVLTPKEKVPMAPDPDGITAASFDAGLKLVLSDKWAGYYQGEKTVLTLALRHAGLFGSTLLEKELVFDAAPSYEVDWTAYKNEFRFQPRAGEKFIVKWSFKRLSKISTDRTAKRDTTPEVVYGGSEAESAR